MWWSSISKDVKNRVSLYLVTMGVIFGILSCLLFVYNPLTVFAQKFLVIKPDSYAFEIWKNPPYDIMGKIYIFNVTNTQAFLNGKEKLAVKEVGPYVYKEILYNTNVNFDDHGTLSFIGRRRLKFIPGLSIGDPYRDTLTVPNLSLLGIISAIAEKSLLVRMLVGQMSLVVSSEEFVKLNINDYLFGYDDTLVSLANQLVPNSIDFPRFGFVDRLLSKDNASNIMSMVIDPSEHSDIGLYSLTGFNGSPELPQWSESLSFNSSCGFIKGCYLGTLFPPNLPKTAKLRLYRHGFCRPIPMRYNNSDITKYGVETYTFIIDDSFLSLPEETPHNHCYCQKSCLYKGIGDISSCYYGIPISISGPHFLNTDSKLPKNIKGLLPNIHRHNSYLVIHRESGLPFELKFRLQLNLNVPDTKFNYRTRPFNNMIIPLLWLELSVDKPPREIKFIIKVFYLILPFIQNFLKVIFAFLSVSLPMIAIWMHFFYVCSNKDYLMLNRIRHNKKSSRRR